MMYPINVKKSLLFDLKPGFTDKQILDFFAVVKEDSICANSAIVQKVADCLQLLNNEENFEQISLKAIGALHLELIEVQPFDVSLLESSYYFFKNVLDDPEKANGILVEGLAKINDKINLLKMDMDENSQG